MAWQWCGVDWGNNGAISKQKGKANRTKAMQTHIVLAMLRLKCQGLWQNEMPHGMGMQGSIDGPMPRCDGPN